MDIILKKQILIDMLFKTIDSHIHYDGYYPKKKKIQKISSVGKELELLVTVGGIVK